MNCTWAQALTRYDCRAVNGTDGMSCLEIGTPFSLPDGSAICLYLSPVGEHVRISDNADTVFQLSGLGLDLWQPNRMTHLREFALDQKLQISPQGEIFMLAREEHAAAGFAVAITGMLAIARWAAERLSTSDAAVDLAAEAQPYIVARNPSASFERHPKVMGASKTEHVFDFRHGDDLIDVIGPSPQGTGGAMRKAGDVQNGPFAGSASPLIIVDDRDGKKRKADQEIAILGAVTRAMPMTTLMRVLH